ncbi:MAG: hypothetical protein MUF86_00375 [Akkermansiaceae bacterium]|jgi:hypothetical protein|nr:hypothetical protein [Akkermansiaceae bacterium]MCU0776109.1 hypothetical protein [Akkermansiaceae bacterium]
MKIEKKISELRRLAAQPAPRPLRTDQQIRQWMIGRFIAGMKRAERLDAPTGLEHITLPHR